MRDRRQGLAILIFGNKILANLTLDRIFRYNAISPKFVTASLLQITTTINVTPVIN